MDIQLNLLTPNPNQPRQHFDVDKLLDLAVNIYYNGLVQPVTVERASDNGHYILHDGERRWRAHCALAIANAHNVSIDMDEFRTWVDIVAGTDPKELINAHTPSLEQLTITAHVTEQATERDLLVRAVIANEQRANLNPIELATSYQQLSDAGMTDVEIGRTVGKSKPAINNLRRLLKLPYEVQRLIAGGHLTARAGRELLRIMKLQHEQSTKFCVDLANRAVDGNYNTARLVASVDISIEEIKAVDHREERYCTHCNMPRVFSGTELRDGGKFVCYYCHEENHLYQWGAEPYKCADCGGTGELVRSPTGLGYSTRRCPTCHEKAQIPVYCPTCGWNINLSPGQYTDDIGLTCVHCGYKNGSVSSWRSHPLPDLPPEPLTFLGHITMRGYSYCSICNTHILGGEQVTQVEDIDGDIQRICSNCERRLQLEDLLIEPEQPRSIPQPPPDTTLRYGFPNVCPTGYAQPVNGGNCLNCSYHYQTKIGSWLCTHPNFQDNNYTAVSVNSAGITPLHAELKRRWEHLLNTIQDERELDILEEHLTYIETQFLENEEE